MKTKTPVQTVPNVHKVLRALRELEKLPEVQAYIALMASIQSDMVGEK